MFWGHKKKKAPEDAKIIKKKVKFKGGDEMAAFIVDHHAIVTTIVLALVVFNLICEPFVGIRYDLTKYLPDDMESKIAIDKMEDTFGYPGSARVMIKNCTLYDAKRLKSEMEDVEGVDTIVWCDSEGLPIYEGSEFMDYDDIDDYYKDGNAVMDVTFLDGDSDRTTHEAIAEMQEILGDRGMIVGMAPTYKFLEEAAVQQRKLIMLISVSLIFVILLFTTTSWFEPVLFLLVIGAAIAINKGTNIFLGTISFVTYNVCDVLQLATSLDYSVFLLNAFEMELAKGLDKKSALKNGLSATINTVVASSMTTFFGFLVLVTMKFKMGIDLGIVMSKSILCSLLMVIFFMPALLLKFSDTIDKYKHRSFMPKFEKSSKVIANISPYVLGFVILIAGPCYVAQNMNHFQFGADALSSGPRVEIYNQTNEIEAIFGKSNMLVVLVPDDSPAKEKEITDILDDTPYVKKTLSLAEYLPDGMPSRIVPKDITSNFKKDGYSRFLIYIKSKSESDLAYRYTEEIRQLFESYYPGQVYLAGNTPTTLDMMNILKSDYTRSNNLAMIAVFIIVMLSFHSALMSVVTMVPIMIAIWLNMAFPYIISQDVIFIGYAVVSCIQLGATIDYSILCTGNYMAIRKTEPDKKKASALMMQQSLPSIFTSGSILIVCGYAINFISTIPAVCEVGHLVGRGALFSVIFVSTTMPILLRLIDKSITTPLEEKRRRRKERWRRIFGGRKSGKIARP